MAPYPPAPTPPPHPPVPTPMISMTAHREGVHRKQAIMPINNIIMMDLATSYVNYAYYVKKLTVLIGSKTCPAV